jgi:5'-phosphate synthase pdxT subunit
MKIGILSFQGGVIEHVLATKNAAKALGIQCEVVEVKSSGSFSSLDGLILPGGESTTISKLITQYGLWEDIRSVPNIFGTCAGAIMLAKKVVSQEQGGQKFLELMNIEADRNAYGSQVDSFEEEVETTLGKINAVFIRAPKIRPVDPKCEILARRENMDVVAISETLPDNFYLATSFHPELSTTVFHELFIRKIQK